MKMTAHKFLLAKDKDKLLQLQDDVFMTITGKLVNSRLETIFFNIIPVLCKEYEVVDVFSKNSEEAYIDLYQDEIDPNIYKAYSTMLNANNMYSEEMDVNFIRFYTKPAPKELNDDK